VSKIRDTRVFLVGSGALGCELMKNFAMCGVGTNVNGSGQGVTVTDMDIIENSNLCRQFLFREWDVQQEKSAVAARAATAMNPEFQPLALNIKVAPDTSTSYDDKFWNSQVSAEMEIFKFFSLLLQLFFCLNFKYLTLRDSQYMSSLYSTLLSRTLSSTHSTTSKPGSTLTVDAHFMASHYWKVALRVLLPTSNQ
jgi:hypothetical protein